MGETQTRESEREREKVRGTGGIGKLDSISIFTFFFIVASFNASLSY